MSIKMWVWAVLCWVVGAGKVAATAGCDLSIDGDTYRRETLISNVDHPIGLAVDFTNNLLYFNFIRNDVEWITVKLNLKTKEFNTLGGLSGPCKFAVDQVLQQVHAGCRGDEEGRGGGLFQFDTNVDQFEPTGEMGRRIESIYYNEVLYYTVSFTELLYTFSKGRSARVLDMPAEVYGMAIDRDKNWTFFNATGLNRRRAGAVEAIRYTRLNYMQGLALDANGAAYVCDWGLRTHALFKLHKRSSKLTRLLDINLCTTITLDGDDNIIYGEDLPNKSIFRLVKC